MLRTASYIAAIFTCALLGGACGSPETPARAESVTPEPASTRAVATVQPDAARPLEQGDAPTNVSPRPPDALARLKAQLNEIAAEPSEGIAPAMSAGAAEAPAPSDAPDGAEELREEVKGLRREVARLQETVDAALAYLVGELGDENQRLKKDFATHADIAQGEDVLGDAQREPGDAAMPTEPRVDYGKDGYLSVKEWGRTAAQAKEIGDDVSSLRGMICAGAPGAPDEELKAIGKRLRESCAGYDNVNIDVFDDETAARAYSERNVRSSEHYVMNIMRHKASGRDVIVLVRDNGAREVVVDL